ncbi:nitroreductase family protein [Thermaurantiacus tibetensis]|uniref:nitroreductase family protein n=1 Tax=Thermaurantiacus tibetensis TaxID=2759035 RepID=UPI00188E8255|nr:nitroreductase family protein [Thermaurantiacus tibetensis]
MLNDSSSPLRLLLTRRSAKARDLGAPGPDPATLDTLLAAAMRVPDHGKLAPWRLVVVEDRERLADAILRLYRAERPEAGRLELKALSDFAHQAPCLVAVVSLVKDSHIPAWEQQLSAGAATAHLMLAAHAAGFAANWLTGPAAYLPGMAEALGVPGGRIAGFVFIGTPSRPLEERPRPDPAEVVLRL